MAAYNDLRDFIRALEKHGELKRIGMEVDPYLEVTEIADRAVKAGIPALLFENPKGAKYPLLMNAFASMRRMEIALGVDNIDEIGERISGFLEMQKPESLLDKVKLLPKLGELARMFPKTVKSGPCKEVIQRDGFSLADYPILHCWPGDGGRFITLPMVFSKNPENGKRKLRHVSDAGVRCQNYRYALAETQAGCGALPPHGGRRQGNTDAGRSGARFRSRYHVFGDSAVAACYR